MKPTIRSYTILEAQEFITSVQPFIRRLLPGERHNQLDHVHKVLDRAYTACIGAQAISTGRAIDTTLYGDLLASLTGTLPS